MLLVLMPSLLLNITTAAIRVAVFVFDVVDGVLAAGTVVAETTRLTISLLLLSSMLSICKTDKANPDPLLYNNFVARPIAFSAHLSCNPLTPWQADR